MSNLRKQRQGDFFPTFFESFFDNELTPARGKSPALNIFESEESYGIELAAPGLAREDLQISIEDENVLVIRMSQSEAKSSEEAPVDEKAKVGQKASQPVRYLRREFYQQNFVRKISLSDDVNIEGITASMNNGVLSVDLPKIKPEEKVTANRIISID